MYTHYYGTKDIKEYNYKNEELMYQIAIKRCNEIIQYYNQTVKSIDPKHPDRLSGYSAHTKSEYLGIEVNGTQENGHETFVLPYHLNGLSSFQFCKTARKPYDVVVVACLIVLDYYVSCIEVTSDGISADWLDGLNLARAATNIPEFQIPETIETKLSVVS